MRAGVLNTRPVVLPAMQVRFWVSSLSVAGPLLIASTIQRGLGRDFNGMNTIDA
jgi:hypothetical protein